MKSSKKRRGRWLSLVLALAMVLGTAAGVSAAAPSDTEGHWAKTVIGEWVESGLASGYPDDTFRPDAPVSRAEFMAFANRAFIFETEAAAGYSDVAAGAWYAKVVAKAAAAGYIQGYPDGTMKPNAPITRQEAAVILSSILALKSDDSEAGAFNDAAAIPGWSKGAVGAVAQAGMMKGYPDGSFRPQANITRAEAVTALNNAILKYKVFSDSGTYGPETGTKTEARTVVVKSAGITLKNLDIQGDLVLAESIGTGSVTLDEVAVAGTTHIRGGGKNSIFINGGSYQAIVVENTPEGGTRIVAKDAAGLEFIIATVDKGDRVYFDGSFASIVVRSSFVTVDLTGAVVDRLEVAARQEEVTVVTGSTGLVKLAFIDSGEVVIEGELDTVKAFRGEGASSVVWVSEEPIGGGGGGPIGGGTTVPQPVLSIASVTVDGDPVPYAAGTYTVPGDATVNNTAIDVTITNTAAVAYKAEISIVRDDTQVAYASAAGILQTYIDSLSAFGGVTFSNVAGMLDALGSSPSGWYYDENGDKVEGGDDADFFNAVTAMFDRMQTGEAYTVTVTLTPTGGSAGSLTIELVKIPG